jgi:ATP/maltotriose-dependent transcriptional regulator MalT
MEASNAVIVPQDMFEPIPRPRVTELLARVARRRIGLIVAPAGYGKSVAVAHYLSQANVPNVWFVVRDEHTKLLGFGGGLAKALAQDVPGLERGLLAAYQSAGADADAPKALAVWVATQLNDCTRTIVVDDIHLVLEEPSVREFIVALIERAPASVRWMLLGRSALDLPLATWLAYGHADEGIVEDDLRIRSSEAEAIAQAYDIALDAEHIGQLLAFTAGWPAAFIFALRAAARGAELSRVAVETREKLYAYLADQAFGALSPSEQQFLLGTALLPVVDLELLAAAGWDEPEATYARLRHHASFLVPESATTFAYHDLFRDFLQHRLRLQGPTAYRRAQLASAALAEAAGRPDWALRLRVAAGDRAGVVRMLRDQAARLTRGGMVDAIEEALLSLPQALVRGDPALLGVFARARMLRGAWEESQTLYRTAIPLAETVDQRAKLAISYASSLYVRQGYQAAFAALREIDASAIKDPATRAGLLSRLAVFHARRREFDEAQRLATETLATAVVGAPELRATILYCASLVSHHSNRPAEARSRAAEALKAAELSRDSQIIYRSAHFLCWIAMNDGDWEGAARFLADMLFHAKLVGDLVAVSDALQIPLVLACMRGDAVAIAESEVALAREFGAYPDSDAARSFARAMRYAWSGDFQGACREAESGLHMRSWAERFVPIFDLTHVATYYAATGNRDAALGAIERASTSLTEFSAMRTPEGNATFMSIGRVLLAVAHATLLRSRAANDLLSHLEQSDPNAIAAVKCLALAARTFNRVAQGVAERDALDRDLAKVRERGLGGYADLLAAFPVGVARSAAAFGTLTKAELQMLRLIARGGTMKAIAAELSRSPDTVETHIRAVLRKLGCKTRNEAVALARDHGII